MSIEKGNSPGLPSADTAEQVRLVGNQGDSIPVPRPPRLGLGIALVLAGGLLGWGAASASGNPATPTPTVVTAGSVTDPVVPRDTRPAPIVTWSEATATPGIPPGYEYAGTSDAVEIGGTIYLIVNLANSATGELTSSLWLSDDGLDWVAEEFEVGEGVVASDLTVVDDRLYMTGSVDNQPALFRSISGRPVGGSSWNRIELGGGADTSPYRLTTEVNASGDVLTVAVGSYDIWRDLLQPFVPSEIDLDDRSYVLREDGTLFAARIANRIESAEAINVLGREPEVVVTQDSVWVRLVAADGREALRTVPLPDGVHPLMTEPPLNNIPLAMVWRSSEEDRFLPVTARSALPQGLSTALAWGDRFVAAVFEPGGVFSDSERATLWTSASGQTWSTLEAQPPPGCSPHSLAVSGSRIHLRAEDGTECVRSGDSEWEILSERNEVAYVSGGPAGFIGYPNAFGYSSALFSRDGIDWTEIEMPGLAPYPRFSILESRLVVLSVDRPRPGRPGQIQVWVGEIAP